MSDFKAGRINRASSIAGLEDTAVAAVAAHMMYSDPATLDREMARIDMRSVIDGQFPDPPKTNEWVYRWVSVSERAGNLNNPIGKRALGWRPVLREELSEWCNIHGLGNSEDGLIRYKTQILHKTTKNQANRLKEAIESKNKEQAGRLNPGEARFSGISGVEAFEDSSTSKRVGIGTGE